MPPDDPTIPNEEVLYRRVRGDGINTVFDENLNRLRPSGAALEISDDGLSVFLGSVVAEMGLGPAAVANDHPDYGVAECRAGACRALQLGVIRDAIEPAAHVCDPAHGLVTGQGSRTALKKKASKLARHFIFVVAPP